MARPPLEIDPERVHELARMGVSVVDIAGALGCNRATLHRRLGEAIRRAKVLRKLALLEAQWRAAEAGDVRMLIWLGKQYLGQSNRGSTRTAVERAGGPRPWELVRSLRRAGG